LTIGLTQLPFSDIVFFMNISTNFPTFEDERGVLSWIFTVEKNITSILYISSKAGAIRANHYHKKDIHYTYLISGEFEYSEKGLSENDQVDTKTVDPGMLVKTEANTIHAMKFIKDSSMVVFTSETRDQTAYEKDTVRVKLV